MGKRLNNLLKLSLLALTAIMVMVAYQPVSVLASRDFISFGLQTKLKNINALLSQQEKRYSGITTVTPTSWGYLYQLENGDVVEVGDSATTDFKANVKTIRWDGVAWFSLGLAGGTFSPTLTDTTVSFNFNSEINVKIYPAPPSERLPEGGIEYDIQLLSRPAQSTVTMNIDWQGLTWRKILPLDIEYDQNRATDVFGVQGYPYTLTSTSIIGADGITYKTRPEYEVNSYLGIATQNHKNTQVMGWNETTGQPITYTRVDRTYLYIHRGQMTDAVGNQAWVEDITLNEVAKTITFTLPRTWLRNAVYPVNQVVGVDPAYTQQMASFQSTAFTGGDGVWSDLDITTEAGDSVVAEIIMSNATTGTENTMGVRANGSSLSRYVTLHEAEGGGQTHARMFVQTDASGIIECYHSDVSDADYFYVVGYWENVGFTETATAAYPGTSSVWEDSIILTASRVYHFILNNYEADVANTLGVRANGSSLERKILVHEPEAGGSNLLDMFVKTDTSGVVDIYSSDLNNAQFIVSGYFGTEMDFVEKWQNINQATAGWTTYDLTAYLDQDGRMCDFLLSHNAEASTNILGARDGDDGATNRYLTEHEAESAGAGGEHTGFGISAKSNASGVVYLYYAGSGTNDNYYLTGYFKPTATGDTYDFTLNQSSKALGTVTVSTTYWTNGSAPTGNLDDAEAYFTITSTGSAASDIDFHGHNATGGVGWTLTSNAPGSNEYRVKIYKEGDAVPAGGAYLTTSDAEIISNLASGANIDWEASVETGSAFTDGVQKSFIITLTSRAVS